MQRLPTHRLSCDSAWPGHAPQCCTPPQPSSTRAPHQLASHGVGTHANATDDQLDPPINRCRTFATFLLLDVWSVGPRLIALETCLATATRHCSAAPVAPFTALIRFTLPTKNEPTKAMSSHHYCVGYAFGCGRWFGRLFSVDQSTTKRRRAVSARAGLAHHQSVDHRHRVRSARNLLQANVEIRQLHVDVKRVGNRSFTANENETENGRRTTVGLRARTVFAWINVVRLFVIASFAMLKGHIEKTSRIIPIHGQLLNDDQIVEKQRWAYQYNLMPTRFSQRQFVRKQIANSTIVKQPIVFCVFHVV